MARATTKKASPKAKKASGKKAAAPKKARKAPAKAERPASSAGGPGLLRPLVSLRRQLDDLLEDAVSYWPHLRMPRVEWPTVSAEEKAPDIVRFDVSEGETSVTVTAELPGVEEKDVEVFVEGGTLTIRGEKRSEREEKGDDFYLSERQYGSFSRSLRLPHGTDVEAISASFDKGVLTVTLPKTATAKAAHRVEVKP